MEAGLENYHEVSAEERFELVDGRFTEFKRRMKACEGKRAQAIARFAELTDKKDKATKLVKTTNEKSKAAENRETLKGLAEKITV